MAEPKWKHHGVRVVRSNELDTNTAQTPGHESRGGDHNARMGAEKLWAGTVVIHPKAKTGAHHHGPVESVIYVVSGKRADAVGRSPRVHRRGGSRRFHLRAAVRAAPGDQRERRRAAVVRAVRSGQEPVVVNLDLPDVEQSRESAVGGQHPSRTVAEGMLTLIALIASLDPPDAQWIDGALPANHLLGAPAWRDASGRARRAGARRAARFARIDVAAIAAARRIAEVRERRAIRRIVDVHAVAERDCSGTTLNARIRARRRPRAARCR